MVVTLVKILSNEVVVRNLCMVLLLGIALLLFLTPWMVSEPKDSPAIHLPVESGEGDVVMMLYRSADNQRNIVFRLERRDGKWELQ